LTIILLIKISKRLSEPFLFLLCLLATQSTLIAGTKYLTFSPSARLAYDYTMRLRFDDANTELAYLRRTEPDNQISYFIENYIDFFRIFIGEQQSDFDRLEKNKDRRLKLIRQAAPDSPYYLYCQATIYMQWALARLKFDQNIKAFYEIKNAYEALSTNDKKFPGFIANKMNLGVLHAILGTIPPEYQWGVKILGGGMKGSIEQGTSELLQVIRYSRNKSFLFKEEAYVMYTFTLLHLNNDPERAWQIISSSGLDASISPLFTFALANLAMHSGRNEIALRYLFSRPKGSEYYPFYYLDYMIGVALLQKLSPSADKYLQRYVNNFKGLNYIKEAYHKLAWSALLQGKPEQYKLYMQLIKSRGYTTLDEDKAALKAVQSTKIPAIPLLRARLLFDGGYFDRANKILMDLSSDTFTQDVEKLEYYYRRGRVAQALEKTSEAISFYNLTLQKGSSNSAYFACNAALNLGLIYEKQGEKIKAKSAFQSCLALDPAEYKTSLHQKAEAGLSRLGVNY